jgi:hypothetical protein
LAPSGRTITVAYRTVDGTATAGQDHLAASGTLTFAPGQTRRTVTVTVLGDDEHEGPETFNVTLSSPTNATLARAVATITIVDDDPPPPPLAEEPVDPDAGADPEDGGSPPAS